MTPSFLLSAAEGLDLQAFLDYIATHVDYRDNDQEYAECFRIFDKDNSGTLSRDEIRSVSVERSAEGTKVRREIKGHEVARG